MERQLSLIPNSYGLHAGLWFFESSVIRADLAMDICNRFAKTWHLGANAIVRSKSLLGREIQGLGVDQLWCGECRICG
jgi:hypothetical protein